MSALVSIITVTIRYLILLLSLIFVSLIDTAIAANWAYLESETQQSTNSTTFVDAASLNFYADDGDYIVIAAFEYGVPDNWSSAEARLLIEGTEEGLVSQHYPISGHPSTMLSMGWIKKVTFSAGTRTIKIQYRNLNPANVWIRNIHIFAWKAQDFQYAATDTEQSLSTTETTLATLNFTPSSTQDYLILASVEGRPASTSSSITLRLKVDSTEKNRIDTEGTDAADYRGNGIVLLQNLDTTSHTILITGQAGSGTMYARRIRIAAIPLGSLTHYSDADETETYYSSITYGDKFSYSPTISNLGDHIVFASSEAKSSLNMSKYNNLLINSVQYHELYEYPADSTDYVSTFFMKKLFLFTGSNTFKIQHKVDNASYTVYTKNARIVVLQLPQEPTTNWGPVEDSYIDQSYHTNNFGSDTSLYIRSYTSIYTMRSLLRFDLSSIPPGSTINSATLNLYYYNFSGNNPVGTTLRACRLTSGWIEAGWNGESGVTWDNSDSTTAWGTAGGDFTTTDSATATVPASSGWMSWDVTNIVQSWANRTYPNNGFLIKEDPEGTANYYEPFFYSQDYTTNRSLRPYISVYYTPASQDTSYWNYKSDGEESTTTSTAYQNKLTHTFTPSSVGTWLVIASFELVTPEPTENSSNYQAKGRVQFDGSDIAEFLEEPNPSNWKFSQRTYTTHKIYENLSASAHTITIDYASETSGYRVGIRKARIFAIRLDISGYQLAYNTAEAEQTNLTTTYATIVSQTFTPSSSGKYLIIASAETSSDEYRNSTYARLNINGSYYGESDAHDSYLSYTDEHPYFHFAVVNLTGSTTFSLEAKSSSGTYPYSDIRRSRITAIRLDDVYTYSDTESRAESTTTGSSYLDKATLQFTPSSGNEYLVLSESLYKSSNDSNSQRHRVWDDKLKEMYEYTVNAGGTYLATSMIKNHFLDASQHTIKIQYAIGDSGGTCYIKDAAILAIRKPLATTLVKLNSFTAIGEGNHVKVDWETKTEIDNLGFNIYRSTERNGTYIKLNSSLIPGLLSSVNGRRYNYIDTDVIRGNLYYYKLEDIDLNGTRTMHGPVCVDWDDDGISDDEDSDIAISDSESGQSSTFILGTGGSGGGIPTRVELQWLKAYKTKEGVVVEWQTGYEVDNLGFYVYREENGELYRLTPELIAGSAMLAGPAPLTAGQHYIWWDTSLSPQSSSLSTVRYWVEDIDLNGKHTMHGPAKPVLTNEPLPEGVKPELLSEVGMKLEERYREYWNAQEIRRALRLRRATLKEDSRMLRSGSAKLGAASILKARMASSQGDIVPDSQANTMQQYLASQPAVKILVKEEGWYRVSQSQLIAAGLNHGINPQYLHLYAYGKEQPLHVVGEGDRSFDAEDEIEFYGRGLDTLSTDTKVYWLIAGSTPGKRIQVFKGQGGQISSSSFPYTVERKDRTIYFAALRNGDESNFFGPIISTQKVDQLLEVLHLEGSSSGDALLEVVLQGVTYVPHRVKVLINDVEVGEVVFDNQAQGAGAFSIPQISLIEGDNLVTFIAQGGEMDVSLIDTIRLTYWHTYTADNDSLKFTAQGGKGFSVGGFSSPDIRVMDITDNEGIREVSGRVNAKGSGYSITFKVPGSGQRTVLTFTEEKVKTPIEVAANQPSSWHQKRNRYDYVIIAYRDFLESLRPLKDLRESQGLSVALIDVEDIYDEFNYGVKSPQALKDFLSLTKNQWYRAPRFVLLVGDASYDPRDYLGFGNFDYVPTKLIDTAYLETASDDWFADVDGDGLADMAVGRLPVQSAEEATTVVSKVIDYEKSNPMKEALLVADIGDEKDLNFEGATTEIETLLPANIGIREIYRGNFGSDAEARAELLSSIDQGPLLVNYAGHGSVEIWRGNILTSDDADSLINGKNLSLFVNMTCLNGFFHDLYTESLAESLLKAGQGGAIAVWASSGLTEANGQALMNKELIRLLFSGYLKIGEATMRAKAATDDEDVRRTWIFFGDPATELKY